MNDASGSSPLATAASIGTDFQAVDEKGEPGGYAGLDEITGLVPLTQLPPLGGLSDGDKGDVTVSGSGLVWTIDAGVVSLAKLANIATNTLIGRSTAGTGVPEAITLTAAGRSLLDDADATAQRTTLGLGTLATQSGTFSGTSSGTNTGDQTTVSGNAGTATALQTPRTINGVSFDGSANIVTSAATLTTPRTINGVSFDGSANIAITGIPTLVKKTADQTFNAVGPANVTSLVFAVTNGRYYHFKFVLIVRSDTATVGVRSTVTTPTFTRFSAKSAMAGFAADGAAAVWTGNITASGDAVIPTATVATNTDYVLTIEGTILPSADGSVQVQAGTETGTTVVTVRQGSVGFLTDFGT